MTESIRVGYKPVGGNNLGIYHKYLVYTNSAGQESYIGIYPQNYTLSEYVGAGASFGKIDYETGVYDQNSRDWDPSRDPSSTATPHPSETIKTGDNLSSEWQSIQDTVGDIYTRGIDYGPTNTNSNAGIDEALRGAGLPPASQDGPSGNWAPGSDFDLPGGDVAPGGKSFGEELGDWLRDKLGLDDLSDAISDLFKGAQRFFPRYDPLTLDLDGDGLETVGFDPSRPVYFDHDLNGTKEGTGWVAPDDGFLVLDRNGNGVIDNGAELFGDHTPLAGGGYAADGFAALVQEDTNADGKVDSTDARFANLRVWRDLNQDGISQASELTTLADANIAAINVAKTANSQTLANGNQIADLGTYIKTDGSTGGLGETHQLADINLAADTFHRQFTTSIPPTPATAALPDMRGSGAVRKMLIAANDCVLEIRMAA